MKGVQLVFSTLQSRKHPNGEHLSAWLVLTAEKLGIKGITVLHASQGVGRDGKLHSASFFELADEPIEIIMNVSEEKSQALFALLETEKLGLFYTKTDIEYGTI
jgi:PII-like signaling protein